MSESSRPVLNVLHTIRSLRVDGVVKVVLRNMGRRDTRGFRHYVCSMLPDDPINGELAGEFRAVGVEPIFVGHSGVSGMRSSVARLRSLMGELHIHVVHANRTLDLALAGSAARSRGIPVVSSLHWLGHVADHPEDADGSPLGRRAEMMLPVVLNRALATRIIAVSHAVEASFARLPGFPTDRVQVMYPGIDMSVAPASETEAARMRRDLGLGSSGPVLLNVGRLEPVKGQLNLIPMMRMVRDRFPGAVLLVAGEGELRPALEEAIASAGMAGAIRLLGTRADVDALLGASDLLVMSSESEAAPLPLLEAMRACRAVVATAVGGVAEIVRDGVTGRLVPRGEPAALAEAAIAALEVPGEAGRMGLRGRELAVERFDVGSAQRALERLYVEVVEQAWGRAVGRGSRSRGLAVEAGGAAE